MAATCGSDAILSRETLTGNHAFPLAMAYPRLALCLTLLLMLPVLHFATPDDIDGAGLS
jgi:hypothetical protein